MTAIDPVFHMARRKSPEPREAGRLVLFDPGFLEADKARDAGREVQFLQPGGRSCSPGPEERSQPARVGTGLSKTIILQKHLIHRRCQHLPVTRLSTLAHPGPSLVDANARKDYETKRRFFCPDGHALPCFWVVSQVRLSL
jgi:hypothetical protein